MPETSKDLLQLEHNDSTFSLTESALLVCNKKESHSQFRKPNPDEKPTFNPLPPSQVLGKVKDFLGVMSEANKRLQLDAKDKAQDYDIEVLTGNESEVIEMDLMLGVADLHTPEAVLAAESAIAGNQPVIPLAASSSGTDSEGIIEDSDDSGDDDEDEDEESSDDEDDEHSDNDNANKDKKKSVPMKFKRSKTIKDESEAFGDKKSQKRPKIVELS